MSKIEHIRNQVKSLKYRSQTSSILRFFFNEGDNIGLIVDKEGILLDVNKPLLKGLGYELNEIIYKPFMDYLHSDDYEKTIEVFGKVKDDGVIEDFSNRYIKKDGAILKIKWYKSISLDDFTIGIGKIE